VGPDGVEQAASRTRLWPAIVAVALMAIAFGVVAALAVSSFGGSDDTAGDAAPTFTAEIQLEAVGHRSDAPLGPARRNYMRECRAATGLHQGEPGEPVVGGEGWAPNDLGCCPSSTFTARWSLVDGAWVEQVGADG